MNQLTTTNNQFTVETLMQKVFEASGYQFTIITPNDSEPHFIAQEVSESLGYKGTESLTIPIKRHGFPLLVLTKENGLTNLKLVSSISKNTRNLTLIPSGVLQEYLLKHATRPKAKEIGNIIYDYFTQPKTLVEEPNNPFKDLLYTEAERLGISKEFFSWYWDLVKGIYWFEKLDYRSNMPNGLKCLLANFMTLDSRFMVVTGKNSAKKVLKRQGASSQMLRSNRTIAR